MCILSHIRRLAGQLTLVVVVPVLAWSQVALVHVTSCGPQAFPSSCTIPSTGAGNLIVVGFQLPRNSNTSTTITGVTDTAGNPYSEAGAARAIDASASTMVDIWYAKNSLAGATSVTITPSPSASSGAAVIWEFSGANTNAPLDQTAVLNSQASTATPTGAAVTITAANEVVVSLVDVAASVTGIPSGNAFVSDSTVLAGGWAHLVTSSLGTYAAQWNQSPAGTYASSTVSFKLAIAINACDLNKDGVVNVIDVELGINTYLACTAVPSLCSPSFVLQLINGALGGTCSDMAGAHWVSLSWIASTSSNLAGYNIYRASSSGAYTSPLNSSLVTGTTFADGTVAPGLTYYYVVRAVDSSGNQSANSNEDQVAIPYP